MVRIHNPIESSSRDLTVVRNNQKLGCVSQDVEMPEQNGWTCERETVHPKEKWHAHLEFKYTEKLQKDSSTLGNNRDHLWELSKVGRNIIATPTRLRLRTAPNSALWAEDGARRNAWARQVCRIRGLYLESEARFFKDGMESRIHLNRQSRREKEFIVDSGSTHMMSKMELSPEELDTVKVHGGHYGEWVD